MAEPFIITVIFYIRIFLLTLLQINSIQTNEGDGPAWNKFWLTMDHESDSMASGGLSGHNPPTPHHDRSHAMSPDRMKSPQAERGDSVLPHESASHHGDEVRSELLEPRAPVNDDSPFPFKFRAPSGRVHRIQVVPSAGIAELINSVSAKLGAEVDAVGGQGAVEDGKLSNSGYALSYVDNEGDTVSITTDQDLSDAINLARRTGRDKVDLFVHDPEKTPIVTPDPQTQRAASKASTPPESVLRSEEGQQQNTSFVQSLIQPSSDPQVINGVPNELILPGAIVTLAAVIAGVFVLSRTGQR